jgi:NADPH:quinone reductase
MKAVAVVNQGEPARIVDLPVPEAGPGHLRVRMRAAGLNPYDGKRTAGTYGSLPLPFVPGTDGAGVVDAVGEGVTKFALGDRVFGRLGDATHGTYAEYSVVAEEGVIARIPEGVDFTTAAALPVSGLAALGLLGALALSPGDRLLIVGATGGVGGFFTQLAARAGLDVIATARPEYAERIRGFGARLIVDHTSATPVVEQLATVGVERVEALADLASARDLVATLTPLVPAGGKAASIAGGIDVDALTARQVTAFNYRRAATAAELEELAGMVARGELKVVVDRVLTLADAPRALEEATQNHMHGKTVFRIDEETPLAGR